jgi:L-ribulose-5-phosphate 3-epimerase
MKPIPRRDFLRLTASALTTLSVPLAVRGQENRREFQLSLSERSLTRQLTEGKIDHLEFAKIARSEFELDAIDYASRFFKDRAEDEAYLTIMNQRAADQEVRQGLLLVEEEGSLGAEDRGARVEAIRNHRKWITAAQALGCRAVCVQVHGDGPAKEQASRAVETLGQLSEYGVQQKVSVLVANDAGPASDPAWLLDVLEQVDSSRCAAFPLFNGFGENNPYEGMQRLMKVAKGVCATSRAFNGEGNETGTDYGRMMRVVLDAGYRGYISVEYQGTALCEFSGIRATKSLLKQFRRQST